MHITRHYDFASLAGSLANWDELAQGVPFRKWDWSETWWRHYGCRADGQPKPNHELFVLTIWDDHNQLLGIAPWYRFHSPSGSRVIRFLGDGEVCSDYLSVLCRAESEDGVTAALAEWLTAANHGATNEAPETPHGRRSRAVEPSNSADQPYEISWDRLQFIGVDAADSPINRLLTQLHDRGNSIHHCPALNTWRLELPPSWEELLMVLSKPHRNRLRRADRDYFQSGRVNVRRVNTPAEWARCFEILVDLHKRRWNNKGLPGAFASPQFREFHRELSARWSASGLASLAWLEMDDKPLAVEYRLHGEGIMYAYQSGMDINRLDVRPGELANLAAIRNAIEHGQTAYDFLRGDEEYKSRWRTQPRPMLSVRVIPSHKSARLRHSAWLAGQNVKQWLKQSAKLAHHWLPQSAKPRRAEPIGEPQ